MRHVSVFLLLVLLAPASWADEAFVSVSPEFSFQSAQEAFAAARVPTLEEVAGQWMLVGKINDSSVESDGYWPDGKFPFPSLGSGAFRQIVTISAPKTDAFGKTYVGLTEKMVGAETGKVYHDRGITSRGVATPTGIQFDLGSSVKGTCRIFQASAMLLCEKAKFVGRPTAYHGLKRAN